MNSPRRGFALLVVLWLVVALTSVGLAYSASGRTAISSTHNRSNLLRAAWLAEGCAAQLQSATTEALRNEEPVAAAEAWDELDDFLDGSHRPTDECELTLRPAGGGINLNDADPEPLARLVRRLVSDPARADSMIDALLDWRDTDEDHRAFGAEIAWYRGHAHTIPRNDSIADPLELELVRGYEGRSDLLALVTTEPGRIAINHVPEEVLAILPGMSPEAVSRMLDLRSRGERVADLAVLAESLSPSGRAVMAHEFAVLARMTTVEPDAWILTSRVRSGHPTVTAVLELRLVRAGGRVAVVRRRSWVE